MLGVIVTLGVLYCIGSAVSERKKTKVSHGRGFFGALGRLRQYAPQAAAVRVPCLRARRSDPYALRNLFRTRALCQRLAHLLHRRRRSSDLRCRTRAIRQVVWKLRQFNSMTG